MSKHRWDAKVDSNQWQIVKALRGIPALSVITGHDDILVGYHGRTYWFEIKSGPKAGVKPHQAAMSRDWRGHYQIVWDLDSILQAVGVGE
jgi:hypothetical protein